MTTVVEAVVVESHCYSSYSVIVKFESIQPFLEADLGYALETSEKSYYDEPYYLVYLSNTHRRISPGRVLIEIAENGSLGYVGRVPSDGISVLYRELTTAINRLSKEIDDASGMVSVLEEQVRELAAIVKRPNRKNDSASE